MHKQFVRAAKQKVKNTKRIAVWASGTFFHTTQVFGLTRCLAHKQKQYNCKYSLKPAPQNNEEISLLFLFHFTCVYFLISWPIAVDVIKTVCFFDKRYPYSEKHYDSSDRRQIQTLDQIRTKSESGLIFGIWNSPSLISLISLITKFIFWNYTNLPPVFIYINRALLNFFFDGYGRSYKAKNVFKGTNREVKICHAERSQNLYVLYSLFYRFFMWWVLMMLVIFIFCA